MSLIYFAIHEKAERAVIPNAPEMRNPATERPTASAAGRRIGLKRRKRGNVTARLHRAPVRVRVARRRRKPAIGRSVATATTCAVVGPLR